LAAGVADVRVAWDASADVVPLALATYMVNERGVVPIEEASLAPECPLAHELLRPRR
jgi:hypothetical protein